MRWLQTEYLLKGIFLGLLLDLALRQSGQAEFTWDAPLGVGICTLGGLVLALALAGLAKLREGYRIHGRVLPFIIFLLLESPTLVYAGILGGMILGTFWVYQGDPGPTFIQMVAGGAALGVVFGMLRVVKERRARLGLSLAMGVGLVAAAAYWFGMIEGVEARYKIENPTAFGIFLLLGLPVFYLLTFAGQMEETEIEVGAMAGTLGLGLLLLTRGTQQFGTLAVLLPLILYIWYTLRVMPGLRVFKHVLRGMSHSAVGRYRPALLSFRRALHLDPKNAAAREEFWKVHIALDADQLARDPELMALVDFRLCVERAGVLLIEPSPGPERLADAQRLLELVTGQKPALKPAVDYWRAVACTHQRQLDQASALLADLLDPEKYERGDPYRRSVLLQAWVLALTLHEELKRRVGLPQLALPGRRMEAIAAVERHMAETPDDQSVWPLKRFLYQDLTAEEFEAAIEQGKAPEAFDYTYVQQLGAALIDDPQRWERGAIYLRMAARGLPAQAPTLHVQVAQAYERAGRKDEMWAAYERARRAGVSAGHKNLAEQERQTFFRAVHLLGENAMARGDLDAALDHFHLYGENERSGIETLRTIAELFERKGDALAALRVVDRALVYNSKDRDLIERRDRYYYSVTPEVLQANLEIAGPEMDLTYCQTKAREVLDNPAGDLDALDWAEHLIDLALVVKPENRAARVLKARVLHRRGDVERAAGLLDAVRTPKPEKFAGGDDEEAWYASCSLLADLYLNNLGRPQDAVACLTDYRRHPKSGAKTWYRLAQAHEQLGDTARAVKCYQQVAAYDGNPLQYDAQEALSRLGSV